MMCVKYYKKKRRSNRKDNHCHIFASQVKTFLLLVLRTEGFRIRMADMQIWPRDDG